MKTLIEGSQDILDGKKYFKCYDCGWSGCAVRNEYQNVKACSFGYELQYFIECPFCKEKAYEVNDEEELLKLKAIDRGEEK